MAGEFDRLMQEAPALGWRVGLGRTGEGPLDRLIVSSKGKASRRQWLFEANLDRVAAHALDWIHEQQHA